MTKSLFSAWVATLVLILATSGAHAVVGSMRCSGHLITGEDRRGPTQYEVLKKCGEPTVRQAGMWIYDKPGRPKKVLHFDGGRLARIEG